MRTSGGGGTQARKGSGMGRGVGGGGVCVAAKSLKCPITLSIRHLWFGNIEAYN